MRRLAYLARASAQHASQSAFGPASGTGTCPRGEVIKQPGMHDARRREHCPAHMYAERSPESPHLNLHSTGTPVLTLARGRQLAA